MPISDSFCQGLANFFKHKVESIRADLDKTSCDPDLSQAQAKLATWAADKTSSQPKPTPSFTSFHPVSESDVKHAILNMGPSSSSLDPIPTPILKTLLDFLLPDITAIVNASLSQGRVPAAWKKGLVTPLLKKAGLDANEFKNYRPITQLRFLARLVEVIVTHQLQAHLELHHLLHDCQSGFRPGRGTELAVADVREALLRSADQGHSSALILLDLSAAFDTVDHAILSSRLVEVAGITGVARDWIISFLSNRGQVVRCGDLLSTETPVPYGVPQGSSLSPLLFNLYLRPLATLLETVGLPFQCYADDTQLMVDLHESSPQAARLVPGLILVQEWMAQSKLKLNGDKTELLVLPNSRSTHQPSVPWPPSWGPPPPPSDKVRDLGVWISRDLDGSAQASSAAGTGHRHLSALVKVFPLLTPAQKVALYHAFVGSRLSYGILSLLGASAKLIQSLQKVQNRAIRAIYSLPWREHISPWRHKLGWLNMTSLIIFRVCLWLWKAYHHQGPSYIQCWALTRAGPRPMRSAHLNKLLPLPVKKARKGGRTIAHKGALYWNALPAHIRSLNTLADFKRVLKRHLLAQDLLDSGSQPSSHGDLPPRPSTFHPMATPAPRAARPTAPRVHSFLQPAVTNRSSPPYPPVALSLPQPLPRTWGLSSPPLPQRNNQALISLAAANKQRLITTGYYAR